MKKYVSIAKFRSSSNPEKIYTVKMDERGNLSCDCPAWIYKVNGKRECKHTRYVRTNFPKGKSYFIPLTDIPTREEAERMDYGRNEEEVERWRKAHLKVLEI